MDTLPLVAAAFVGYVGVRNWQNNPGNLYTDNTQIIGSSPGSTATNRPNVQSSAYDAPVLNGINSQIPNPRMKAKDPRVPHTAGKTPYVVIQPNSSFEVEGTAADVSNHFDLVDRTSREYLRNHPASVPFSPRKQKPLLFDVRARSQQYMGAADTALLASIPVQRPSGSKPTQHQMKLFPDFARATKSYHYGTLLPGTKPAYAIHPDSAHTSPSAWTQIYTGRKTKVVY